MANTFYGALKGQGFRKSYRSGTIANGIQSWAQARGRGTIYTKLWFDSPRLRQRRALYEVRLYFEDIVFSRDRDVPDHGFMVLARGELNRASSTTDANAAAASAAGTMSWPL